MVLLVGLALSLTTAAACGQIYNEITAVSPNSATQGTTALTVTFTLDTDVPPAPPADVLPQSVTIGSINGTSVIHSSQYTVTAVFDIPSGESAGAKDVSISFEITFEPRNNIATLIICQILPP